jgi:hypothetical protein
VSPAPERRQKLHRPQDRRPERCESLLPVKKIAVAIFAEGQDQGLRTAVCGRDLQRNGIRASQILVAFVELLPLRGSKIVPFIIYPMQIGGDAKHRFAIAPGRYIQGIAGGEEQFASDHA